jgi:hypothetical protein
MISEQLIEVKRLPKQKFGGTWAETPDSTSRNRVEEFP